MTVQNEPGPRELIKNTGLTLRQLAAKAELAYLTVQKAAATDTWPTQRRTRRQLACALGINESSTHA